MAAKITFSKSARVFFCFLFVLTEVAPWTIDLPEVRRFLFEKEKHESKTEYEDYVHSDRAFYSNAQGNSLHNSNEHHGEKYAQEFGYQSYMEKKVKEIVHDGSRYLEGLRRSLEDYNRFLEECNRRNMTNFFNSSSSNTTWTPPAAPSAPNMSMNFGPPDTRFQGFNTANWTGTVPGTNMTFNGTNMPWTNTTWMNMTWTNTTWRSNNSSRMRMSCREATEASEKVRRYADLAMWATKRLQDIAYAAKYQETDQYEENELILKLAWFLDQLAVLTGYEPDYKNYLTRTTTPTPTPPPMRFTLVPQTQEMINFLTNCVKANSSVPATIRCQYPLPIPDLAARIVGVTSTQAPQSDGSNVLPITPPDSNAQQSLELLITADDSRNPRRTKRSPNPDEYYVPIPVQHEKPKPIVDFIVKKLTNLKHIVKSVKKHAVADFASQIAVHKHLHKRSIDDNSTALLNQLSNDSKPIVKFDKPIVEASPIYLPVLDVSVINTKSFKKRSIDDNIMYPNLINGLSKRKLADKSTVKSVTKRSADNPFSKLANYYIKYKVWDNSNPAHKNTNDISTNFEVNNHLTAKKISKRSLFHKKHRHFLIPKLLQMNHSDKHKYIKFHSTKKGKGKLLSYVGSMLEKKRRKFIKNHHKIVKRSLLYEHMYLPRTPTNPVGDISYYVKNKEGRNYNPSLTQAALVRLGLQQAFETGNIEVIHRYGSNYNPANPAPFYTGVMKGMADV